MEIKDILNKIGFTPIDRQENDLSEWGQFFKGHVHDFHEYTEYQGIELGHVTRKRKSLKMAKSISELWADNLINPETEFVADDKSIQTWIDNYVDNKGVKFKLNDLMELSFALGTGATIQSKDKKGNVFNQYIPMYAIWPLRSVLGEIVDCAFINQEVDESCYAQIHEQQEDGTYIIYNKFFDKDGTEYINEDIESEFRSDVKLFQLYSPAIVNNINIGNPLGISIYANAIDELKSVDIAYDALDKEARNGRMRVYVQGEALQVHKGSKMPIFNKDQDEFYLLPEDAKNPDGTLINVQSPTLRIDQYINNLEKQLNMLGSKCGLGDNAFYSQDGTIYTNTTQVISTNSKFYKTRQKHATRIEKSLIDMLKALYYLDTGNLLESGIHIEFDDSIIHDKDAEYARLIQQFNLGLISRIEFYEQAYGMTNKEAVKFNDKQIKESTLGEDTEEEGMEE